MWIQSCLPSVLSPTRPNWQTGAIFRFTPHREYVIICQYAIKKIERLVFPNHAMKEYSWREVELHVFLISAPAILTPGKNPATHWIWRWGALGACLDVWDKKTLAPDGIQTPDRPACSHTDYTNPVPCQYTYVFVWKSHTDWVILFPAETYLTLLPQLLFFSATSDLSCKKCVTSQNTDAQ